MRKAQVCVKTITTGICLGISLGCGLDRALAGPDVAVSDLNGIQNNGVVGAIRSYSVGTTACNIGTGPNGELAWFANDNRHPVISTNLYRLVVESGRFEQIGQAWLKHGWCAADSGTCPAAGGGPTCMSYPGCEFLGVGCTDVYSSSQNAEQTDLGPKSEVNPVTGVFPYPYVLGWDQTGNAIYKRLQVPTSEIFTFDPVTSTDPNRSRYFAEGQYIHYQDAAISDDNNVSWRQLTSTTMLNANPSFMGSTMARQSALEAWKVYFPEVTLVNVDVPGDGRFIVGYRVIDLGGGMYRYDYAIQNLNSHRAGQSFAISKASDAVLANIGFHDVDYHSGEPYVGADWAVTLTGSEVKWACETEAVNVNANALRWATMYNFRFDCNKPPVNGTATLGIFRAPTVPSPATSVPIAMKVPEAAPPACACPGDVNASNSVDGNDIPLFTQMYLGAVAVHPCADVAAPSGGPLDAADLNGFIDLLTGITPPACP